MTRKPISSWEEIPVFKWADYSVLAVMLSASAAIGIYYACTGGKQKTAGEFLLGDRKMSIFPVAMSLLAGFLSSITLLGIPAEVYMNGLGYWCICISFCITVPIVALIFIPLFHGLGCVSVFEYLEKRFSRSVRIVAFLLFSLNMLVYMAVVLYGPAIALSAVTRIPVWTCILIVGSICTFYTSIGGVKAVIWTDTMQIFLMFAGSFAALGVGIYEAGGLKAIIDLASQTGRLKDLYNFNPDPRQRHSVWSVVIGGVFVWVSVYGVNQAQVQRYLCLSTVKKAQTILWIGLPGFVLMLTSTSWTGLALYHYFKSCDPLWQGLISAPDQILPLFILETLGGFPGLPGLFVVGVFSGSLSTISSGVNSLAANLLEDCFLLLRPQMSELMRVWVAKIAAVCFGFLCIGGAFAVGTFGQMIEIAYVLFGMIGGPLLGLFSLGIFFPWANSKGALTGFLTGLALVTWIGLSAKLSGVIYPQPVRGRNLDPEVCRPLKPYPLIPNVEQNNAHILDIYEISYLWYGPIGCTTVVLIGLIISFLTGPTNPRNIDPRLSYPLFAKICFFLPKPWRAKLKFGVRYLTPNGSIADIIEHETPYVYQTKNQPISTIVTDTDCSVCAAVSRGYDNKGAEYQVTFTVL